MAKKQVILEQILKEIYNRAFMPGEKLYSVRELADKFNCSHMTAYNVLAELEERSIIFSKSRSGYFLTKDSLALKQNGLVKESLGEPNYVNIVSHLIKSESIKDIIPLGTAARFNSLLPIKQILPTPAKRDTFFQDHYSQYAYPPGCQELRARLAIANRERQIEIAPEEMVLTNGALESIYLSLRLTTHPGDKVLVSSPAFFGILQMLDQLGLRVIEVPEIPGKGMDLVAIKQAIKLDPEIKLGIFQVNFTNPSGHSINDKEKQALVKAFAKSSKYIIEDDTYGDLDHLNRPTTCLKSFDRDNNTVFQCSSFSKTLGPGFRVGWLSPPKIYLEKVIKYKMASSFSGSSSSEEVVLNFLKKKNQYASHLKKLNKSFKYNMQTIHELLVQGLPKSCTVELPKGGFCLWLTLPASVDSFNLYKTLMEQKVAISPGSIFSSQNRFNNCIRINAALELTPSVIQAIKLIISSIKKKIAA